MQSSDYDPDGLSIAADALRLNGGSVKDAAGNDADLDLGSLAITNHPDHKVDGSRDPAPAVRTVEILSRPPGETRASGTLNESMPVMRTALSHRDVAAGTCDGGAVERGRGREAGVLMAARQGEARA